MTKFFLAASLILLISLLIFTYYWTKQFVKNSRDKKLKTILQKKYRSDEKEYLRNFISYHLPLLIENDIQWISIWSKLNSDYKVEITYNSIISKVQIGAGNILSLEEYEHDLSGIGISEFSISNNGSSIKMNANSKIIVDVLYFIFKNIYKLKEFSNYKIVLSSG
jgi:uncharacterized SAM-binding protein YcdF (DUF218 family)